MLGEICSLILILIVAIAFWRIVRSIILTMATVTWRIVHDILTIVTVSLRIILYIILTIAIVTWQIVRHIFTKIIAAWEIIHFILIIVNFYQPIFKYWIALLSCLMLVNLPNYLAYPMCYVLGVLGTKLFSGPESDTGSSSKNDLNTSDLRSHTQNSSCWQSTSISLNYIQNERTNDLQKYEGWMLTYAMASQNYSPSLHHQSSTKITFIKIEGNNLAVYFPQSNHKIPKTRFWKDAKEIPSNIKLFAQYNLCGATIELAPTGLSKKRTWRRKYPISITFELPYLYQMVGNMGVKNRAIIQKDTCGGRRLYLFARTHREKYDWYFRLKHASYSGHERMSQSQAFATFVASMKAAYPNLRYVPATPTTRSYEWKPIVKGLFSPTPPFVSLIIARYCFGFLNSSNWRNEIRRKIEKQLRAARKPAFVESVTIKELNLGTTLAKFPAAANPFLDSGGIWFDIGMEYEGKIQITLEFIFNFFNTREMKMLKDKPGRSQTAYKQAIFDSNAEDSGDASETDLAKFTDKIANSAVMRNGIVHDIVEKIAALPVLLTVEVTKVSGILAVNIPMVSSDRVWIGFRDNPVIEMEVIPKVTAWQWAVNLLKGWIKKRMLLAFQHCMVCPNMLDIRVNLEPTSSTNNS